MSEFSNYDYRSAVFKNLVSIGLEIEQVLIKVDGISNWVYKTFGPISSNSVQFFFAKLKQGRWFSPCGSYQLFTF